MKYKELVPMFHMMEEAAELLRKKRFARGSVDFDFLKVRLYLMRMATRLILSRMTEM